MRLVFSLAFVSLALASLAVPAAFASPNTGAGASPAPKAPVAIPLVPKPTATPTPTPSPAPTSPATPLPTVLTLEIDQTAQGTFTAPQLQKPLTTPLLDYRLAGSKDAQGRENTQAFILMPMGANATLFENYFYNNVSFTAKVFVPPNTVNTLLLAQIASFNENVSSSQNSVKFAINFGAIKTATVPTPVPILLRDSQQKPIIPGHAP